MYECWSKRRNWMVFGTFGTHTRWSVGGGQFWAWLSQTHPTQSYLAHPFLYLYLLGPSHLTCSILLDPSRPPNSTYPPNPILSYLASNVSYAAEQKADLLYKLIPDIQPACLVLFHMLYIIHHTTTAWWILCSVNEIYSSQRLFPIIFGNTFPAEKAAEAREQTNAILIILCSSPLSGAEIKPYFAPLVALQFVPTHWDLYHWDLYPSLQFVPTHCQLLSLRARCTVHSVQCTEHSAQCTVKYVQCIVRSIVSAGWWV